MQKIVAGSPSTRDRWQRCESGERQEDSTATASIEEVVRYLRQQDDVVVFHEDGSYLINGRFRMSAAELIARFQITASDPFFQFEGMDDDTLVKITAYVLKMNGAKPGTQPLTRTTSVIVNSLVE